MTAPNDPIAPLNTTPTPKPVTTLWRRSSTWRVLVAIGIVAMTSVILFPPHAAGPVTRAAPAVPVQSASKAARIIEPAMSATTATSLPTMAPTTSASTVTPTATPQVSPPPMLSQPILAPPLPSTVTPPNPAVLEADQHCQGGPLLIRQIAPPPSEARVVGFLTRQEALAMIPISESGAHGLITPQYIQNRRAVVQSVLGQSKGVALVPDGMTVTPGEIVSIVGGHADPMRACHYIPNLIVQAFPAQ